jgi:hypothetical protein
MDLARSVFWPQGARLCATGIFALGSKVDVQSASMRILLEQVSASSSGRGPEHLYEILRNSLRLL